MTDTPPDLEKPIEIANEEPLMWRPRLLSSSENETDPKGARRYEDSMTYNVECLVGWNILLDLKGCIWNEYKFWLTLGKLFLMSGCFGVLAYLLTRDPSSIELQNFERLTTVLNIFVSLMLGFFLNSAVSRWLSTINGYMDLFNAVRNIGLQLYTLGAPQEKLDLCMRYGALSTYFLSHELRHLALSPEKAEVQEQEMWNSLQASDDEFLSISAEERAILDGIRDVPDQIWLWVGSVIGRMAEDGEIPSMSSPTYGRIMNLAQVAQESIRDVRVSIEVKTPFIYVSTLAVLVHITTIMFAVSLGLTMGVSLHSLMYYAKKNHYIAGRAHAEAETASTGTTLQSIVIEAFRSSFAVILYQAFFELGLVVSTPFTSSKCQIPVNTMMLNMLKDLEDQRWLAKRVCGWERPRFQRK